MLKDLITTIIVLPLVAAVSFVVPTAQDTNLLILNAETQLQNLATRDLSSSTPNAMVLSVLEINNKATLAKNQLDQSKEAYTKAEYFKASWLAGSAKRNTDIVALYINLLLNRETTPANRQITLQGNLADLVLGNFSVLTSPTLPVITASTTTDTVVATASSTIPTPPLTKQACLEQKNTTCQNTSDSCLASARVNTEKLQLGCSSSLTKETVSCAKVPNKVRCLTAAQTKFNNCQNGNISKLTVSLKRCQTNYNTCLKQAGNACKKLK